MKLNATELACVRSKGLCITEKRDGWGKLLSQTSAGGCQGTFATSVPDESESRSTRRSAIGRRYRRPIALWLQQIKFHSLKL